MVILTARHDHASYCVSFNACIPNARKGLIRTQLRQLNVKKACGYDFIPAKLLKLGATVICNPLTSIINTSIALSIYPNDAKKAEISPMYKKNDNLVKMNYRPVSILTALSKVFEGLLCDQLSMYIYELLSENLSAYRKHYSCNNVLVKCIEDFRKALDLGDCIGCALIDLSSALDSRVTYCEIECIWCINGSVFLYYELFIRQKSKSQNCTFPKQLANFEKRSSSGLSGRTFAFQYFYE